ncbi:MAG TPA: phytanoyl-CoA dioxygenase family protein [Vicinamibacterales bacterium]|nr:phytanoyl-CoA dioxygenase family protein [Vicinamibacterales bacterium]
MSTNSAEPGFRIVPGVLDEAETSALLHALDAIQLSRSRAGARHMLKHPAVAAVAQDPRLLAIAAAFVGPTATPYRATLFDKSPARNWLVPWHQDTALPLRKRGDVSGWGPWSIKNGVIYAHAPASALERVIALRLHLDDSLGDNGPLRVLPGTHALGVLSQSGIDRLVHEIAGVDCLVPAGGVIAMRPLLLHASSKAASERPRRVLHIEYADSMKIEPLDLAIA